MLLNQATEGVEGDREREGEGRFRRSTRGVVERRRRVEDLLFLGRAAELAAAGTGSQNMFRHQGSECVCLELSDQIPLDDERGALVCS